MRHGAPAAACARRHDAHAVPASSNARGQPVRIDARLRLLPARSHSRRARRHQRLRRRSGPRHAQRHQDRRRAGARAPARPIPISTHQQRRRSRYCATKPCRHRTPASTSSRARPTRARVTRSHCKVRSTGRPVTERTDRVARIEPVWGTAQRRRARPGRCRRSRRAVQPGSPASTTLFSTWRDDSEISRLGTARSPRRDVA